LRHQRKGKKWTNGSLGTLKREKKRGGDDVVRGGGFLYWKIESPELPHRPAQKNREIQATERSARLESRIQDEAKAGQILWLIPYLKK